MSLFFHKKSILKLIAGLLIAIFTLLPFDQAGRVQKAEAIPVFDAANTLQQTLATAEEFMQTYSLSSIQLKETVLDGIAWALINSVIHEMSQSIITWINSGFKGSPAFVTDLGRFLTGVVDKVAGEFIWGSNLGFLCSPFRLDIRMALDIQYRRGRDLKVQCTLTDVINNVNNFAGSANPTTNWDRWFQVSMRPENNVYGSLLLAQESLGVSITNARGQQIKLLEFGKGFLSKQQCEKVEGREVCRTVTPGTTIENQLNSALNLPAGRLQVADEINEIVAALFTQLARQAISGVGGLLGLTQSGSGGSGSYFDRINTSTTTRGINNSTNPIETAITDANAWNALHMQRIDAIDEAEEYLASSCQSGSNLPNSLENLRTASLTEIIETESLLDTLTDMAIRFSAASSTPGMATTSSAVMTEYMTLQSQGEILTQSDVHRFKVIDLADARDAVQNYKNQIDNSCRVIDAGGD